MPSCHLGVLHSEKPRPSALALAKKARLAGTVVVDGAGAVLAAWAGLDFWQKTNGTFSHSDWPSSVLSAMVPHPMMSAPSLMQISSQVLLCIQICKAAELSVAFFACATHASMCRPGNGTLRTTLYFKWKASESSLVSTSRFASGRVW